MKRAMRNTFYTKSLLFMLGLSASATALASNIQAFGVSQEPFNGHLNGIKPCYLDIAITRPAVINSELKAEGDHFNKEALLARYNKDFNAISDSLLCQYQAKKLGVQKLPAVVFDHKYVVYGEINLEKALAEYNQYKERIQ